MNGLIWVPVGIFSMVGLGMAANAADTGIYAHGLVMFVASVIAGFAILQKGADVRAEHAASRAGDAVVYNDRVIKAGVIASVFWGIVGFAAGVFIALQLAFPVLNLDLPWTTFGRLRP